MTDARIEAAAYALYAHSNAGYTYCREAWNAETEGNAAWRERAQVALEAASEAEDPVEIPAGLLGGQHLGQGVGYASLVYDPVTSIEISGDRVAVRDDDGNWIVFDPEDRVTVYPRTKGA